MDVFPRTEAGLRGGRHPTHTGTGLAAQHRRQSRRGRGRRKTESHGGTGHQNRLPAKADAAPIRTATLPAVARRGGARRGRSGIPGRARSDTEQRRVTPAHRAPSGGSGAVRAGSLPERARPDSRPVRGPGGAREPGPPRRTDHQRRHLAWLAGGPGAFLTWLHQDCRAWDVPPADPSVRQVSSRLRSRSRRRPPGGRSAGRSQKASDPGEPGSDAFFRSEAESVRS